MSTLTCLSESSFFVLTKIDIDFSVLCRLWPFIQSYWKHILGNTFSFQSTIFLSFPVTFELVAGHDNVRLLLPVHSYPVDLRFPVPTFETVFKNLRCRGRLSLFYRGFIAIRPKPIKMYAFPNQNASVWWGLTPARFFHNFVITLFWLRLLGTSLRPIFRVVCVNVLKEFCS